MPVNEILAPVYVRSKYVTPAYPQGHVFTVYFAAGCTWSPGASGDEDNWRLMEGGTDHGAISGIMHEIFTRAAGRLPASSALSEIALWHSIPSSDNVLDHFNTLPSGNSYGSGDGFASAYWMGIFQSTLRQKYKMTFFDGGAVDPQKYPGVTPPSGDDSSLGWYILKSGIPFATNDGIRVVANASVSTGYNRKLAKSYGRTVTP
jgi:hypothetical protein